MNNRLSMFLGPGIQTIQDCERNLIAMRTRLQDMFGELCLVRDVITVSVDAMISQVSSFDPDVGRVLFRCGAEKLYGQLESLSDIIEQLGGRTEFSKSREKQRHSEPEACHVGS